MDKEIANLLTKTAQNSKMRTITTQTHKAHAVMERLSKGEPISHISREEGVPMSYIRNFFRKAPHTRRREEADAPLFSKWLLNIRLYYYATSPRPDNCEKQDYEKLAALAIQDLSKSSKLSEAECLDIFNRAAERSPKIEKTPFYSSIQKWREEHSVSLRTLASHGNCTVKRMKYILRGWSHMPLDVALKISQCSGLTIAEIYSDLLLNSLPSEV